MLIQRLRDGSSGILTKIIVGLIIIVFGLFGFGSITTFLAPVAKVARVNGSDITQQEMEIAVERRRQSMLSQQVPPEEIDDDELRQEVLDALVLRRVMRQAADEMELYVGTQQIDKQLLETAAFQIDGVFDSEQFRLRLGGAGYTPLGYREEVMTDDLFKQMISGIQESAFLMPGEASRAIALNNQTRDFAWLRVKSAAFMDEVTNSDAELDEYYEQHLEDFTTEESVELEYIELKQADLMAQVEFTEDDIEAYYEAHKDSYAKDESRQVSHILVSISEERSEAEAKTKIDTILAKLKDGGDFEALARADSDDPGSGAQGGDLGFNEPGIFVKPFEDMVYSLEKEQLSVPVLTQFGYHIIKVTDIEAAHTPGLSEIRDQIEEAYQDDIAADEFVTLSAQLGELAFEHIDLEIPAQETGLTMQTTGTVTRTTQTGLMVHADVVAAAFSPEVLVDGNNSDLLEINETTHLVLRALQHAPGVLKDLSAVREEINNILLQEKVVALAEQQSIEIVEALQKGSLVDFVADQYDLAWETSAATTRYASDIDAAILEKAFALPAPAEGIDAIDHVRAANGDSLVLRVYGVNLEEDKHLSESLLASWTKSLSGYRGRVDFQIFQDSLLESASLDKP